jgi:MFS family permease
VTFLIGSVPAGRSETITELIIFRAIQGIGGGGLLVGAQTIVGDIVSPRDRGRYQGFFGAVFGVASVLGPLIGGFFVDTLSWRWVFYVNLPVGIVAFIVVTAVLPAGLGREQRKVAVLFNAGFVPANGPTFGQHGRLSGGSARRSPDCTCSH